MGPSTMERSNFCAVFRSASVMSTLTVVLMNDLPSARALQENCPSFHAQPPQGLNHAVAQRADVWLAVAYSVPLAEDVSHRAVLFRSLAQIQRCLMKSPDCSSFIAWRSCSCVFITMGPYHATGSSIGLPDTSRKRMPASPAWTETASPRSNRMSERFCASENAAGLVGPPGPPASRTGPTCSVLTAAGADASRNVPLPSNT